MARPAPPPEGKGPKARTALLIGIVGLCVWLAWAVVINALVWRGPPAFAVKLAPTSPVALTRLAHEEQRARRMAPAETLARASLRLAPFNAVALRVLGMSLHEKGETARAEPIMTLAGNWDLRDSPTQLWLFEQRVRAGEHASGFAHLDTVLRRRSDIRERLFAVVKQGLQEDPRVFGALAGRLALAPNWRPSFLSYLARDAAGRRQAVSIAASLNRSGTPLSDEEVRSLSSALLAERETAGLKWMAQQLGLLDGKPLRDAGFEGELVHPPFGWDIRGGAGASVEVVRDDTWNSRALLVSHDGLSVAPLARQLLALEPGRYALRGRSRGEDGPFEYYWRVACVGGPASEAPARAVPGMDPLVTFSVPPAQCDLQWLELRTRLAERTRQSVAVFDDLSIERRGSAEAAAR